MEYIYFHCDEHPTSDPTNYNSCTNDIVTVGNIIKYNYVTIIKTCWCIQQNNNDIKNKLFQQNKNLKLEFRNCSILNCINRVLNNTYLSEHGNFKFCYNFDCINTKFNYSPHGYYYDSNYKKKKCDCKIKIYYQDKQIEEDDFLQNVHVGAFINMDMTTNPCFSSLEMYVKQLLKDTNYFLKITETKSSFRPLYIICSHPNIKRAIH